MITPTYPYVVEHIFASDSGDSARNRKRKQLFIVTTVHSGNDHDSHITFRIDVEGKSFFTTTSMQRAIEQYNQV